MRFKILQSDILPLLTTSSRFVSARAQLPILSNIKLQTLGNKLQVCATNLEMSISANVGAKVMEEGDITVPAKQITDLVSNMDNTQIEFEAKGERLTVKSANSKTTLAGTNSSDFPEIRSEISEKAIKLSSKEFIESLPQVAFCSSQDDTRPALSGVLVNIDSDISLVSTDGYRLSKRQVYKKDNLKPEKFILPKGLVSELLKVLKSENKEFSMHYSEDEKQVLFEYGGFVISSRVVDGEYPDFEKIIPKKSNIQVNVAKQDLLQAIKVVSVIARESANIAELRFGKQQLSISAESSASGEGESILDAKVDGGRINIKFNYKFLLDFINSCRGETVFIGLNDASSPAVFKDISNEKYMHLIMPVKV